MRRPLCFPVDVAMMFAPQYHVLPGRSVWQIAFRLLVNENRLRMPTCTAIRSGTVKPELARQIDGDLSKSSLPTPLHRGRSSAQPHFLRSDSTID